MYLTVCLFIQVVEDGYQFFQQRQVSHNTENYSTIPGADLEKEIRGSTKEN